MELELKDLCKAYGNVKAADGLNAVFRTGIAGILGPNGAGKSTLFNMLTTNLQPDSGSILLDGCDIFELGEKYRSRIGYMPQQQAMYPGFTAIEFLSYIAALKGMPKAEISVEAEKALDSVGLLDCRNRKVSQLSGGMKQRVLLAQALLGSPEILILDEPTAGLDPKQRILMRQLLSDMAEDRIILIATHIVSDVEHIANQICILGEGKILLSDYVKNCIRSAENGSSPFGDLEALYTHYFGLEDRTWE